MMLSAVCANTTRFSRSRSSGKERDTESGNDYFGARYYASSMGRFMSADEPFANFDQKDPQSFNLYSYVENNPLNSVDPDGRDVRVCSFVQNGDGSTGQSCNTISDAAYKAGLAAQQAQNANNGPYSGIQAPGGERPNGDITCNGQLCGTATYVPNQSNLASGEAIPSSFPLGLVVGSEALMGETASGMVQGGLLIGRISELQNMPASSVRTGDHTLVLPDLGSPQANWAQNSSRLREAMAEGQPIRDMHVDGSGNLIHDNPQGGGGGAFLKAERNLLENHGWTYDQSTTSWYPPKN